MHSYLRQSTASQSRAIGPFLDDADFVTAETGLTIANTDIKLVVNGAASANKNSGGGTHRINGVYGITFDATDTATVGEIFVSVKVAGALPVFATFVVLEEAVYDMLFAASALGYIANAPVNVAQFGGSNGTFAGGRPEVNTTLIEGSDATNQIRDAVVDDATRIDASALNTLSSHDPGEAIMGATDLGTGAGLTSLASAANLATVAGYLDTEIAAILQDTGTTLDGKLDAIDALVDAIKAVTDALPDAGALTSIAQASALATVDTVVDGIKAVTDALPDAGALTSIAQASALATVDGVVDAIKVNTDKFANLPVLTAGGTGGQGYGAP